MEWWRCFWQPYNWQMPGENIQYLAAGPYGNFSSPFLEANGGQMTLSLLAEVWCGEPFSGNIRRTVNLGAPSCKLLRALPARGMEGVWWCHVSGPHSRLVAELVFAKILLASHTPVRKALPVPLGSLLYQWHCVIQINAKCSLSPFQCNNSLSPGHLEGWVTV